MESSHYLSDDSWETVINHLNIEADQRHLDSLSLVSKQLLSVTNQALERLKVFDRTKIALPAHLMRFPHLKMIDLSDCSEDITSLLHNLASSDLDLQGLDLSNQQALPLESLKEIALRKGNFQVLKCSRLSILRDSELTAIGDIFPSLEELDISFPSYGSTVTDQSIIALSTKLSNLAKINLAGNLSLSNECLMSLSSNCRKLREVILQHCSGMTQDGVAFLVKNNPNLVALSLAFPGGLSSNSDIPFASLRVLNTLEFSHMSISDHVLFQIADAKIPLKRFSLCHCQEYTFAGVIYFLHTYDSLESIAFADVSFLNDQYLILFSKFFKRTVSIKLNCCPKLTDQAFSTLWVECTKLEKLEMAKAGIGHHNAQNLVQAHPQLEYLNLSGNRMWGEETTKRFALLCPNMMYLDLSCGTFLSESIIDILENCKKLRHLKINWCRDILGVEGTSKFERLEILEAVASLSNQSVTMFARRSPALRYLNLMYCHNVTGFVRWMVEHRPQLRHVVPPYCLLHYHQYNNLQMLSCPFCKD